MGEEAVMRPILNMHPRNAQLLQDTRASSDISSSSVRAAIFS